jgi:hypothetical protein
VLHKLTSYNNFVEFLRFFDKISKLSDMKPGSKTFRFSRLKCTKTHLRASSVQKNFFRLAGARHEGEGGRRGVEGRDGRGRE